MTWRVYKLNDYEWWVARSLDEAKADAANEWGCKDVAEAEREDMFEDPSEVPDEELDRLKFTDGDEDGNAIGALRSWRDELTQRIAAGLSAPELFAARD